MRKNKAAYMLVLFTFVFFIQSTNLDAAVLYQHRQREEIAKGVIYEKNRRLDTDGWLDIHVLEIDLSNEDIRLGAVNSSVEPGLKESTSKMLSDADAVAGVNGDFFGIQGTHSQAYGPEVDDGELESTGSNLNGASKQYSTFYVDNNNNPFIGYFNTSISLFIDGNHALNLSGLNKTGNLVTPSIIDSTVYKNTASIDKRGAGIYKLVIENEQITYISGKGETVNVPEGGHVVLLPNSTYPDNQAKFSVGKRAVIKMTSNLYFDNIDGAIGGGGRILEEGKIVNNGFVINGRQPRTAVGYSKDLKTVYLMVIDGRSHSKGATHDEIGHILLAYGAHDAMHLDGGGSSTMAVKNEDGKMEAVNKVSDGSERKVINTLGVIIDSKDKTPKAMKIIPSTKEAFVDAEIDLNLKFVDSNLIELDEKPENVVFTSNDPNARFDGNKFYPSKRGIVEIKAEGHGFTAIYKLRVLELAKVSASREDINLELAERINPYLNGFTESNIASKIDSKLVSIEVMPPNIAKYENGVLEATENGGGYIKYTYKDKIAYSRLTVGNEKKIINALDKGTKISYIGFPENVLGSVSYSDDKVYGDSSMKIAYNFPASTEIQAAYLAFEEMIYLGNPNKLHLAVKGDNSNLWLRAKIVDSKNSEFLIDFSKDINFADWQNLTADIPTNVVYPIKLDRIYIANAKANSENIEGEILIDQLEGTFAASNLSDIPKTNNEGDFRKDSLWVNPVEGEYDLSFFSGLTNPSAEKNAAYKQEQAKGLKHARVDKTLNAFFGNSADITASGAHVYKKPNAYAMKVYNECLLMSMVAGNGKLSNTAAGQWQVFKKDALASDKTNLIITLDRKPSEFSDKMEYNLFHEVLQEIAAEGKTVIVVSSYGKADSNEVLNGIRYINLAPMWINGARNNNFKVLKLRFTEDSYRYDMFKG